MGRAQWSYSWLIYPFAVLLFQGSVCLVLWYGGYLVYHRQLQPGTLIAIMLYALNLAMSFAFLSNLYGEFMQAVGASTRIFELIDRESDICDGKQIFEPFRGGTTLNSFML